MAAWRTAIAAGSLALGVGAVSTKAADGCFGYNDPPAWGCYRGSNTVLGLTENVQVNLREWHSDWQKGVVDIYAWGTRGLQCTGKWFEKHGQDCYVDWSNCLPSDVQIVSSKYCSDSNSLMLVAKDGRIPVGDVTLWLQAVSCNSIPGNETALACSGSADPPGPGCYEGSAGALGVTENVKVNVRSFSAGQGVVDVTASGARALSCVGNSFTKSGQAITLNWGDCLPTGVSVTSVEYCSDTDSISLTAKDSKLPLPAVTTVLNKVACSAEQVVV